MKNGIYVIDRIENEISVLINDETGEAISVPVSDISRSGEEKLSEGTAIEVSAEENGQPVYKILSQNERPSVKEKNKKRLWSLMNKNR